MMSRKYRVKLPCLLRRLDGRGEDQLLAETVDVSRDGFFCIAQGSSRWEVGTEIECAMEFPVPPTAQRAVTMHGRGKIVRVISGRDGKIGLEATAQFKLAVKARPQQAA